MTFKISRFTANADRISVIQAFQVQELVDVSTSYAFSYQAGEGAAEAHVPRVMGRAASRYDLMPAKSVGRGGDMKVLSAMFSGCLDECLDECLDGCMRT